MYETSSNLRSTREGLFAIAISYASLSASSAVPSTSPCRSKTVRSPLSWMLASNDIRSSLAPCFALRSRPSVSPSQTNDELDGVVDVVTGHVHLIDHVLDQEQPPTAR